MKSRNGKLNNVGYSFILLLCIVFICLVIMIGGYITYKYLLNYHNQHKFAYHTIYHSMEPNYDEIGIDRKGKQYKTMGITGFYEDYVDGDLIIKIKNICKLDTRILSVVSEAVRGEYYISEPIVIKKATKIPKYTDVVFKDVPAEFVKEIHKIKINYAYDNDVIKQVNLVPYPKFNYKVINSTIIRDRSNIDEFEFVELDDDIVRFVGENIVIDRPIIIPKGYTLQITPGQQFDIINSGYIISYSGIECVGTNTNKIKFISSDNTGMGIYICQAKSKSTISNTIFTGLSSPQSGIWHLTASVTFYDSDVEIDNCSFENSECEDILSIVCSDFIIKDSSFNNALENGLNVSYSTGEINNCTFNTIGKNAIYSISSDFTLNNLSMTNVNNCGVYASEESNINVNDTMIENAYIGLSATDSSTILGENIELNKANIGLALYQVQTEFLGGSMILDNFRMTGLRNIDYILQKGSKLLINNEEMNYKQRKKEKLLIEMLINGEKIK